MWRLHMQYFGSRVEVKSDAVVGQVERVDVEDALGGGELP